MRIGTDLRLALLVVSALALQYGLAPAFAIAGVTPDLLLLVTVSGAMVAGPDRGAAIGFGAGLAMDLLVETPFGLWALTSCVLGWSVGRLHAEVLVTGAFSRWLTALWASAAGIGLFVLAGLLIGQEYLAELALLRIVIVVSLLNAFLVPFAVRAMRWALAGTVGARAVAP